jgi:glycosyltransferase involved in cell wall biosynthesis
MISLIHPSRGRPQKSYDNAMMWMRFSGVPTELIISLDSNDPKLNEYCKLYAGVFIADNDGVVQATNRAAAQAKGDILVYLSDDFACFPNWGKVLVDEFAKHQGPTLIKVDDMLQDFHVRVLTIPIMNKECYEKLGYFFHTGYKSMHCDEHLYHRTRKLGFLKMAPHIKFEHRHVSVGKAENDDTYNRSAANWNQGKAKLEEHRRMGFIV